MEDKKKITNFAIDLEDSAKEQFDLCAKEDFVIAASLMPDAHSGYVAPIGSVLVTKNFVVPSWVGYDIGCGMIAVKFSSKNNLFDIVQKNKDDIYKFVNKIVPMGLGELNRNLSSEGLKKFEDIFSKVERGVKDRNFVNKIKKKALDSLGTLGSGNHFIELGFDEQKDLFCVIHSGSRNVGHQIASYYMKKASGLDRGYEKTCAIDVRSDLGHDYLLFLDFCLEYALLNRLEMAKKVYSVLKEFDSSVEYELWTNKNHNHAIRDDSLKIGSDDEVYVHRKGATPAKLGERGVIPGNMRDGSFLVEGLGSSDFLESSSHGAGRKLSRKKAKESISMEEFKKSMEGIKATIKDSIRDEAPQSYKNIFDVMDAQKDSVKVVAHIKPIINWKG